MHHETKSDTSDLVQDVPSASLTAEDAGLHKGLKSRQIQMIAIGGAIGTGLFMGAGGRLASAGPALISATRSVASLRS